jgi:hypothetical protein
VIRYLDFRSGRRLVAGCFDVAVKTFAGAPSVYELISLADAATYALPAGRSAACHISVRQILSPSSAIGYRLIDKRRRDLLRLRLVQRQQWAVRLLIGRRSTLSCGGLSSQAALRSLSVIARMADITNRLSWQA